MKEQELQDQWHKQEAIDNFNGTWDLLDSKARTEFETLLMIHKAHASVYHWDKVGTDLHRARGEWLVSRVYSILKFGESALYHAKMSLAYCVKNSYGDFDLAFAYEALARAYTLLADSEQASVYIDKAKQAAEDIDKADDKEYFLSELATVNK